MHSKYWTLSLLTTLLMPTACGESTSSAAADDGLTETSDGNELGASGSESQDGSASGGSGLEGDGDGDGGTIEGSAGSGIPGDGDPGDGDPGDGDGDAATSGAGDGDGDGDGNGDGDGDGSSGDGDGDGGSGGDGDGDGDGGGDGDGDGGGDGDGDGGGDGDGDGGGDGDGDGLEEQDNVCLSYHVLNLANRRISFNDGDGGVEWCDRTNSSDVDPQWQGLGWYRLMEPAGTMLPEYPPAVQSCGTEKPGWMIGEHPALVDGVVDRVICFAWANDACQWQEDIKVVNCDGYYLYRLPDASTCSLRYCATAD